MTNAPSPGYGAVAKSLHWLVVILLVAQYIVGWTMPHVGRNTLPVGLIFWHVTIGMTLLAVIVLRFGWKLIHPVAPYPGLPRWQNRLASALHGILYLALVAHILMGWANASARAWNVDILGILPMPWIMPAASRTGMALGDIHNTFAWTLLALIVLHVAAALYHYVVRRDRVLQRMLPGSGD